MDARFDLIRGYFREHSSGLIEATFFLPKAFFLDFEAAKDGFDDVSANLVTIVMGVNRVGLIETFYVGFEQYSCGALPHPSLYYTKQFKPT